MYLNRILCPVKIGYCDVGKVALKCCRLYDRRVKNSNIANYWKSIGENLIGTLQLPIWSIFVLKQRKNKQLNEKRLYKTSRWHSPPWKASPAYRRIANPTGKSLGCKNVSSRAAGTRRALPTGSKRGAERVRCVCASRRWGSLVLAHWAPTGCPASATQSILDPATNPRSYYAPAFFCLSREQWWSNRFVFLVRTLRSLPLGLFT